MRVYVFACVCVCVIIGFLLYYHVELTTIDSVHLFAHPCILALFPRTRHYSQVAYDVWSIGAIIYELCTGQTLFPQDISDDNLASLSSVVMLHQCPHASSSGFKPHV